MRRLRTSAAVLAVAATTLTTTGLAGSALASSGAAGARAGAAGQVAQSARSGHGQSPPPKVPTMVGRGGAVTSVDADASRIGLRVLKNGGNAVDAAVATAAALGVTEPFSTGIGGGGYFVHYDARTGKVETIDGRETAPKAMPHDAFIDPQTGDPYPFTPERVTSGVSVGTPGTLATWQRALQQWGTRSLSRSLRPAAQLARRGFVVDQTFHDQTTQNEERFKSFRSTRRLYWRHGHAPRVGSRFRNPDLAATYDLIRKQGPEVFYDGRLGHEVARTAQKPPTTAYGRKHLPIPPGYLTAQDLRDYRALDRAPTHSDYRGYDVYGMAPSSSGGLTVGEALDILEQFDVSTMDDAEALHHYIEASALAFADRNAYDGDPAYVDVPQADLLSDKYAAERACLIDPQQAMDKPVAAGDVTSYDGQCDGVGARHSKQPADTENVETSNLTVADRWGDVVEYTLTIEQTGGSGMVVPGRGFLLNNELTDFSAAWAADDPNRIEGGKRPRSSMSPTILLKDDRPFLALGSPGGSTIITTVLQMLFNRIDRGMSISQALAAPRASNTDTEKTLAEPAFIDRYGPALAAYGQQLQPSGDTFTSNAEIGAATAIEFGPDGLLTAAAEPKRRGGGSARVVHPQRTP